MTYEGEFLNGKRNGKGKLYVFGNLMYEGEFLDNEKNGKGTDFFENGKVQFKGEYLKGNKWNGKAYDINGNLIYELKDGCGKVKIYNNPDKLMYEGELLNGLNHGKGKEYYNKQLNFEGEFIFGIRNGFGKKYENGQLIFEGEYLNGKKYGKGKEYNTDGQVIYEGNYVNDGKLIEQLELIDGKLKGNIFNGK